MSYDENLAERIRVALKKEPGISERKMFGGIGFMLEGNMVAGVNKDSLMLRIGADKHDEALSRTGASVFDLTGRPMKGWLLVAGAAVSSDSALRSWLDEALAFARSLPAKNAAAPRRPMRSKAR